MPWPVDAADIKDIANGAETDFFRLLRCLRRRRRHPCAGARAREALSPAQPDMNEANESERRPWAVFLIFLRLGLTSFGGPVAHLGYFHAEFVTRRRWLGERAYADLVALCQFLPGPASSQVGMALGLQRAGYGGALAAWAGFTLPSAVAVILFARGLARFGDVLPAGGLHGLKIVAVAVVAQAVWGMAGKLCTDRARISLMALAACVVLALPTAWTQIGVIVLAGLAGLAIFTAQANGGAHEPSPVELELRTGAPGARAGWLWLAAFFALLAGLPLLAALQPEGWLARVDAFYRAGALVFGGGHVVLPLLQAEVVPPSWVDNEAFLAGYGAAQAVPGPLFTFAAFLGAAAGGEYGGWMGGVVCLLAIFAPSFLLVAGALPFWERLRRDRRMQAALAGINAAVVGLLLAALYQPVWTNAIHRPQDFALGLVALVALLSWKWPPWVVVAACGVAGGVLGA
jgi:chromate transporter